MELRGATSSDVSSLAGVQLRSALAGFAHIFPGSIPKPRQPDLEEEWAALIAAPHRTVLAAIAADEPVGAVAFGPDDEPRFDSDSVLLKLYVVPEHWGLGIGRLLHDRSVVDLIGSGHQRARLWVLERNLVARRMYERRGWQLRHWSRTDWPGSGLLELGYSLDLATRR